MKLKQQDKKFLFGALILGGVVAILYLIKNLFFPPDSDDDTAQQNLQTNFDNQANNYSKNFSDSWALNRANLVYDSMNDWGTDVQLFFDQFIPATDNGIQIKKGDIYNIFKQFGLRKPTGIFNNFIFNPENIVTWINGDLDESSLTLTINGVTDTKTQRQWWNWVCDYYGTLDAKISNESGRLNMDDLNALGTGQFLNNLDHVN